MIVRLWVDTQFLNYVRTHLHCCEADEYSRGGWKLRGAIMKCGFLGTREGPQVRGENHVFMLVDPTHLAHSSV